MTTPTIYEVAYTADDGEVMFEDAMFFLRRPDGSVVPIDFFFSAGYEIDDVRSGIHATVDGIYGFSTATGRAPLVRLNGMGYFNEEEVIEGGGSIITPLGLDEAWVKLCTQVEEVGFGALVSLPRIED